MGIKVGKVYVFKSSLRLRLCLDVVVTAVPRRRQHVMVLMASHVEALAAEERVFRMDKGVSGWMQEQCRFQMQFDEAKKDCTSSQRLEPGVLGAPHSVQMW